MPAYVLAGSKWKNGGRIESSAPESVLQSVNQTSAPKVNFFVREAGPTASAKKKRELRSVVFTDALLTRIFVGGT